MKLILISPEKGDLELKQLPYLFDNGLEYFHLRKPSFDEKQFKEYLSQISPEYFNRLILHAYYHLAGEYGLLGIHYTERERRKTSMPAYLGHVSASFHSIEELKSCEIKYSYVFLSPVFDSISKHGYTSRFKKEDLSATLPYIPQQVIALGGVDVGNLKEVKEMGFSGAAVLGAVWSVKSPLEKFDRIKDELKSLQ